MKFDNYTLTARIFPAILCSAPFFVLHFFLLRPKLGEFWGELLGFKIASDITVTLVLLFTLTQLCRHISKTVFEERLFEGGRNLPTTSFLLHLNDHFSDEYTQRLHAKIASDFRINLPTSEQEQDDVLNARKLINEAIGLIRAKVRRGNLVGQHNAEYGFWRNLAGGSVIALLLSILNSIFFLFLSYNLTALSVSLALMVIYFVFLVFAKSLIISSGNNYAKVLLQEYL